MKQRFCLKIEYDGTNYCGWQRQADKPTIQAIIEDSLKPLNGERAVTVIGAGRTDSGVHAREQVAHFDLETKLAPATIARALNATLPPDIRIRECQPVADNFHARFDAVRRCYKYQILTQPSVFERHFTWYPAYQFDEELLQSCADSLLGEHDFTRLCKASAESTNKVCHIFASYWEKTGNKLVYTITANRFLHSMVRMLVGSMTEVSRHKYPLTAFKNLLGKNGDTMQVYTAPAKGLILWAVEYKENAL